MKENRARKLLGALALTAVFLIGSQQMGMIHAAGADGSPEPSSLDADVVEYDMKTGVVTAEGDVLMKRGISRLAGAKAIYNINTREGMVEGNVVAVREDMRITCDKLTTDGPDHMLAIGNVHGVQQDKTFTGEQVEYFPEQNQYVMIPTGGVVTSKDGTFTADYMEGWLGDEHYIGTGNAHLVSPPHDLEAGGDRVDYFGKEQGKAILTGHAWAIQENNMVRGNRLTIYLAQDGKAKVQ